ncbi:thioredoxin [Aggregatimonas sangjinii]|uniref:Thioredoxin n=1 Tax=Aggregatimonas sangjinii TaxID=2583587 RepID=A0A5B7SR55_9FLAO|nr:thioredoxin [Aggregatimonas sangjinii]QCW99492.1 thioredoxin [Aggregatimonas sangjinii]
MKGNFDRLIHSESPVLIDFYADWCGPCKVQLPILKEVSDEIDGKARIIKIDVDKNQPWANRFQVKGVPTLILFKNGEIVWRNSGVSQKSELVTLIEKYS